MEDKDQHWLDKVVEILTADTDDLAELAKIAGIPISMVELYASAQPAINIRPSLELENQILDLKKSKTQNFRFSGVVKLTIEHPQAARFIFELIDEKTSIALKAMKLFNETFVSLLGADYRVRASERQNCITAAVLATDKALKSIFHMNRGRFIFALAHDLGWIPEFNDYLRSKLKPTLAMANYSSAIKFELDKWKG